MDIYINNRNQNIGSSHRKPKQSQMPRQAFGELKNVMGAVQTPFKSGNSIETKHSKVNTTQKIVAPFERSNISPNEEVTVFAPTRVKDRHLEDFDEGFIDCIDFNKFNCCQKTDDEVWSEMNVMDDLFITKLIEGVNKNLNNEDDDDVKADELFEDMFVDTDSNSSFTELSELNNETGASDVLYTHIDMPDFTNDDDDFPFDVFY